MHKSYLFISFLDDFTSDGLCLTHLDECCVACYRLSQPHFRTACRKQDALQCTTELRPRRHSLLPVSHVHSSNLHRNSCFYKLPPWKELEYVLVFYVFLNKIVTRSLWIHFYISGMHITTQKTSQQWTMGIKNFVNYVKVFSKIKQRLANEVP